MSESRLEPPAPRLPRDQQLVEELLNEARGLLADGATIGDIKIAARALGEMRAAFRMFAPYRNVLKVSTFGSARTQPGDRTFQLAEQFAHQIANAGFMVITGAGPGIMEACQRGAGRERSFGINIALPFEQSANEIIHGDPKLLTFRYFFTRKLFFVKEAHAVVLFPGGFGTHDEGFEALTLLQTGKSKPLPVVFLDSPGGTYWKTWHQYVREHLLRRGMISEEDFSFYMFTDQIEDAVHEITRFYRSFHSLRFVGDRAAIRVKSPLSMANVALLEHEFADIMDTSGIQQRGAFREENDEPDLAALTRLVFKFNRTHFGRLRVMIDRINDFGD